MRCLVTGAAGFIGSHLVSRLLWEDHAVFCIDSNKTGLEKLVKQYDNLDIALCERVENLDWLPLNLDVIFHLAAVSRTVPAIEDPVECMRTNVMGTANILELARKYNVPKVVVSSSNVVMAGATAYRDSKRCVEDLCETYNKLYKQNVVALRYSNVYGSGIPVGDPAVFAMLRDSYQARGYVEITGDGEQTRDFTHVKDIVSANIAACNMKRKVNRAINICTNTQTSMNKACEMLKMNVRYIADRPGDVKCMPQNNDVARAILEWEPTITIEKGIKDIWVI